MKVKEFIDALSEFNPDMEVIISDGTDFHFYHTNAISFSNWEGDAEIGIGGCQIDENDL